MSWVALVLKLSVHQSDVSLLPHAGATECRRKLLAARGWRVISVPYFDWSTKSGAEQQQAYLRSLLPEDALETCKIPAAAPEAAVAEQGVIEAAVAAVSEAAEPQAPAPDQSAEAKIEATEG